MKNVQAFAAIVVCFSSTAFSEEVDFARDVQPILNAKCVECHGGVKAAGGVSFVYEDRVINFEADSGEKVVSPGKLDESEMIRRVTSEDEFEVMPPPEAHGPLSEQEVGILRQWVKQGAKWRGHWAFLPPKRSKIAASAFEVHAENDLDQLIFTRLEREGLKPSGVESSGRLLRRLSLGLTGLPPTLKELDEFEITFEQDPSTAVKQTVEELLSRPAFGERWASMWLDLVRYADSGGLGLDQRRTIWPYRDWVVNALNDDMPFDEFTIKQLAGDLLPSPTTEDLIATACNRNTQTNNEGGTDDETFRLEAVVDRVNTTWQTWGGTTFGCVQCHDHPYDPLRNTEYYQFMAFMNNTADSDLNNDAPRLKVPNDVTRYEESESLHAELLQTCELIFAAGTALREDSQWRPAKTLIVKAQNDTPYSVEEKDGHAEFFANGTVSTKTQVQIMVPVESLGDQPTTAVQLTVLPLDPETSVHSPEWGFTVTNLQAWIVDKTTDSTDSEKDSKDDTPKKTEVKFRWSVPDVPWMPDDPLRRIELNGKNWGAESRIHHRRQIVLVPQTPLALTDGQHLLVHVSCDKVSGGSHPLAIKRGHFASTSDPRWSTFAEADSDVKQWSTRANEIRKKLGAIPGTSIPVMADRPSRLARPTHVFVGGNAMVKGDRVTAGLPATLTRVAPIPQSPTRLDMGKWWVSDQNPLTARVFVNRVWEQLFGTGIVPTLEDFGSSGEKPTHPELLDHLAIRFQKDHQWSVKSIVREMAVSHVFRQSSKVTPGLLEVDPANRLLARGPRLRLSAESMRDHALAVSGLLTPTVGGKPVFPPLPSGVWKPFDGGDKWTTAETDNSDRYRRSLYTYMKRSIPFPTFATFDAPSREFCTPRRLTSNTPLQALVTLNEAVFVECAEALGRRMESDLTGTPADRVAQAHRIVTGRRAGPTRVQKLVELYETLSRSSEEENAKAWTVVAQVLLNLDETLTY